MCLCCTHQHKWSTEAADAVVLAPLSLGPHVHAGGCFRVVNTRCCLLSLNILFVSCRSLKCKTTALFWQQDVSHTLLPAVRVKAHVVVLEYGARSLAVFFNSLIYDYVIQKWWCSVVRRNMCVHRVQPRLCWLLFCFHWKMTWTDHS